MTIRAQMPDGTVLEFPDGTSDAVVDRVAKQHIASAKKAQPAPVAAQPRPAPAPAPAPRAAQAPKPAPQPAVVDNGGNWFTSAIKRGAGRTLSGLSELVSDVPAIVSQSLSSPAFRTINPFASAATSFAVRQVAPAYKEASAPVVQAGRQRGEQIVQAAGPRRTQAVTDIATPTSLRQVPRYLGQVGASAAETVSESAIPILAAAGTGVVTRSPQAAMIVSGATSAPMTYGSIRDTQRETGTAAGGEARAAVATVASTLLDSMFGSSKFASTLTQQAAPMGVRAIVREAAKQAGEESITEMAQTAIERAGGGKDLVSRDAMKDYIESGVVGAFGGGAISGGVNTARAAPSAIRAVPGALRSGLQQSADLINRIALPTRGTPEDPLPQDAVQVDPLGEAIVTPDPAQPTGPQAGPPEAPRVEVPSPAATGAPMPVGEPHPLGTAYPLPDGNKMVIGQTPDGNWHVMLQNSARDDIGGQDDFAGPDKTQEEVLQMALGKFAGAQGGVAIAQPAPQIDPATLPIDPDVAGYMQEYAQFRTADQMAQIEAAARQLAAAEGAASVSQKHMFDAAMAFDSQRTTPLRGPDGRPPRFSITQGSDGNVYGPGQLMPPGVTTAGSVFGGDAVTQPAPQTAEPVQPAPAQAEPVEPAQPIQPRAVGSETMSVTVPATGKKVNTQFQLVDAADLKYAEGQNQNRDRTRVSTNSQIQSIIGNFDPTQLGVDAYTDRGAPIIGKDGTILSGNGRVMVLNQIYDNYPELAAKYREFIESQGFDTTGIERPVLTRGLMDDLSPEELRSLVVGSNKDNKQAMSAPEIALQDAADILTPTLMAKFNGGSITKAANSEFVRGFMEGLSESERAAMRDSTGNLSTQGVERIENAIMARAYGGGNENAQAFLRRALEQTDDDAKTLTGALTEAAPAWLRMREAITAGEALPQYDITDNLMDAIAQIRAIKARGLTVADWLRTDDMFNAVDPLTRDILLAVHNDKITRFQSKPKIAAMLERYSALAAEQRAGEDMFGMATDPASPQELLRSITREADNQAQLVGLEDRGEPTAAKRGREAAMFDMVEEVRAEAPVREGRANNTPSLRAAVRWKGRTYRGDFGETHEDVIERSLPTEDQQKALWDADVKGYVDERGKYLDRFAAAEYAKNFDLIDRNSDRYQGWMLNAPELSSDTPLKAPQPAAAEEASLEDRSGISGDPKGNYTTKFREASFTNRTSIYEGAIRAMGYEPDKFRLFVPERQAKILSDALKKLTGIEVELDNGLNLRLAIDQLLDAHQTLQGMAYVLGIAPRALSLDGSLKLKLLKKGGFLGVFYPDQNAIGLPGRSNSFAHEWSHALDYYLMKEFEADGRGLSGAVRQGQGELIDAQNVRDAFVNLMNAMFFDKAEMAAKILALETQIAKSKSDKRKAELQAKIDRLKGGSSQMKSGRTKFYENAKEFDGGSREYWQSPTEMMARSFEAYVGFMTQMEGFGSEFIGKGNDGYLSNLEERFAKTFPKDEERNRIFEAFGDLMFQLQKELLLKPSDGVRPDMGDIAKMTDFDRHVEMVENGSLMSRELKAFRRDKRLLRPDMSNRANDPKGIVDVTADIAASAFFTMAGQMKMLERRYQSKAIKAIHDKLTYTPGAGEYTARNFAEEVEKWRNKNLNRVGNVLKANDLLDLDEAGLRQLRDALISESTANTPDNIVKGAAALRQILDAEFYRNTNAGIQLGYARGVGYLKRMIDLPLVMANQEGFVADAGKVYEKVFDRDIGDSPEEILDRDGSLKKFMFLAKKHDIEGLEQLRKINRQISKLESQQKTSDDPDQILAKLEQLYDERLELVGEMFDDVRSAYGTERAEAWLGKMLQAADYDFDAHSPDNSYTKNRELPPEADKLLERFYVQNPLEAVTTYIEQSARRVAYAERFGPQSEKLKELVKQMAAEGVSVEDQNEVLKILNIATGRVRSNVSRSVQRGLSFINAAGTVTMLPRAVLSSLSEAVTAGLAASNAMEGIRGLSATLVGTKSLNGRQRAELARAIGIVTDIAADMTMEARIGGRFGNVNRWDLATQRMFENTGLTALTRAQRTHVLASAHAFLDNLAQKAIDGDLNAIAMLNELGISDPKVFSDELLAKGRMPTVEELDTAWGDEYALASQRFVNMTIQQPTPMDRPQLANNPVGRIVYGITGFSTSFWRKVLKRHAIMTAKIYKRTGFSDAAKHAFLGFLPAALTLFVMQAAISTLREWLLNRERWNDLEKKGELEDTMAKLAFTRTFAFGMADPFIQAYTGLKYQRDLSNVMVGAVPGMFLQNTQAILNLQVRDSAKTNTAEYNATRAAYNIGIAPAVSLGLSMAPGGQIARAGYGAVQMLFTSPQAGAAFATAMQGPKGSKTDPETGEVIGPPPKKKEK